MIFITHFDSTYLAQGLTMISSLLKFGHQEVRVLALDEDVMMSAFAVPWNIWDIRHAEAFYPRLIEIRKERSRKAWAWTLEPAWCAMTLRLVPDGEIVVYVDADSFWFADPVPTILSVMENADVALSPHRFPAGQEHRYRSVGKFNFGVSVMRACDLTRKVVGEWLDQTLEKCDEYAGGDQVYLDSWIDKLGMRLVELPQGWNVGPWQNAVIIPSPKDDSPLLITGECGPIHAKGGAGKISIGGIEIGEVSSWRADSDGGWQTVPLISAHMHEFRRGLGPNPVTLKGEPWNRTFYPLHELTIESVYRPYEKMLEEFL